MSLHPVHFANSNDVDQFIQRLKQTVANKDDVEKDEADTFALQLLVASDGNTYLLDEIAQLSRDEARTETIHFVTEKGTELTVLDIQKALENQNQDVLDTLIYNTPLADMLINKLPPVPSMLHVFPIVFPVITHLEETYEQHGIEDYLAHCRQNGREERNPFYHQPLHRNQLFENTALEELIKIRMLSLKEELKNVTSTQRQIEIEQELKKYQLSLLSIKMYYQEKSTAIEAWRAECDTHLAIHPALRDKTIAELKVLGHSNHLKRHRLHAISEAINPARYPYLDPIIGCGMAGSTVVYTLLSMGSIILLPMSFLPLSVRLSILVGSIGGSLLTLACILGLTTTVPYIREHILLPRIDDLQRLETCINNLVMLLSEKDYIENFEMRHDEKLHNIESLLTTIYSFDDVENVKDVSQTLIGDALDEEIKFIETPINEEIDESEATDEYDVEWNKDDITNEDVGFIPSSSGQASYSFAHSLKRWGIFFTGHEEKNPIMTEMVSSEYRP